MVRKPKGNSDYPLCVRRIVNLPRILNRYNYVFMIEVSIKIQEDEASISERFLQYDPFWLAPDDPVLKKMIDQVKAKYKGELINPDVIVKVKMTL